MTAKVTPEIWLERFRKVHGNKYDYSFSVFGVSEDKVKIYCTKCFIYFEQSPMSHYTNGSGCPSCGSEARSKHFSMGLSAFLDRAKNKHGQKYDYSLIVSYKNWDDKVKIICNACKYIFEQRPGRHLMGADCPRCKKVKKLSHDEFVSRVESRHGKGRFVYIIEYQTFKKEVEFICAICKFKVKDVAHNHLLNGCSSCNGHTITTERFVKRLENMYGTDKFDYSKTVYSDSLGKTTVICKRCSKTLERWCGNILNRKDRKSVV